MSPETLAQWRQDAAIMREFTHSIQWTCLKRHLDLAIDAALTRMDSCAPSETADMLHWRAVRKGFLDAKELPEAIVRQADTIEAQAKAEQARLKRS